MVVDRADGLNLDAMALEREYPRQLPVTNVKPFRNSQEKRKCGIRRSGSPLGGRGLMVSAILISCLISINCASYGFKVDGRRQSSQSLPSWAYNQPVEYQVLNPDARDWRYLDPLTRLSSVVQDDESPVYGSEVHHNYELEEQALPIQRSQQPDAAQVLQQVELAKMLLSELRGADTDAPMETNRWRKMQTGNHFDEPVYQIDHLDRLTDVLNLADKAENSEISRDQDQRASHEHSFASLNNFGKPTTEEDIVVSNRRNSRESPKLTTLLEDEEETNLNSTEKHTKTEQETKSSVTKTTESPQSTTPTTLNNVVTTGNEVKPTGWARVSQMYRKLVDYLPSFKNLWGNISASKTTAASNKQTTSNIDTHIDRSIQGHSGNDQQDQRQSESSRPRSSGYSDSADVNPSLVDKRNPVKSEIGNKQVDGVKSEPTLEDTIEQQPAKPRVSKIRKSTLSVPMDEAEDEPRLGSASSLAPATRRSPLTDEALIGRYNIYAPTHHYHLGTPALGANLEAAASSDSATNDGELGAGVLSYFRSMQPSQASAAAFTGLGGLRSTGTGPNHPDHGFMKQVANNDAYFLVMVSAFCVMAMAVVLAAGLFAYRIQQGRKSSSEPEYPTYGVVGPNSIAGKQAGLAGYGFGPTPTGAANLHHHLAAMAGHHHNHRVGASRGKHAGSNQLSVATSGKGGHHQHPGNLGDLYSAASDSGIITSSSPGSGKQTSISGKRSASNEMPGGFMANQNAARMYHYQQQKQQMIAADRVSSGRHTSASDMDSDEDDNEEGSYTVYECPGLASAHEMEIKNPLFNDDHSP